MQHQQQEVAAANGTIAQQNGNSPQTHGKVAAINGVGDIPKPTVKLDQPNKEMVRIIGQHLTNLGFKEAVQHLMEESGCRLDHPQAGRFRVCVLGGDWQGADEALQQMQTLLLQPQHIKEMRFLLLEQKYMELIESGDDIEALNCLRGEISPLEHNVARVHRLSSLIFYNNPADLKRVTNWQGSGPESRSALMDKLSKYLPVSVMLPPRRLEKLVIQALQQQVSQCEFHNTSKGPQPVAGCMDNLRLSDATSVTGCLLTDHRCSKETFPTTCLHTLADHTDEVLIAAFSPDGHYLATGGKDCLLMIWEVDKEALSMTRRHALEGHTYSIVFLSWSHDSTMVIVCMEEDAAELVVWDVKIGKQVCKVSDSASDSLTCAAWYKSDQRFVCGGLRGQFYLCNLEGVILERWEGVRVQSVAIDTDGRTVLASDTHRRIRGYHLEEVHDHSILQEDHGIMSFGLDATGRFALLNVTTQGVHLWDLKDRTLVRKFRGATQGHCTIHSCFGGVNQDYIASGSEDHKVYIWHRNREQPVAVLSGHQRTVNSVTWNPVQPDMLVSVSDDNTIRIWGPSSALKPNPSSIEDGEATSSPVPANGHLPHTLMSSLDISEN